MEGLAFSHPDSPSSRIRSQLAHTGPAGLVWGFAGIVSLTWLSKSHTGPHRVDFVFSPKNELTPPPKGGGAGYCLSRVCWFFHAEKPGAFPQEKTDASYPRASLGSCLWQLLLTTGSPWHNRAGLGLCWCRFPTLSPTRLPKPHTGPYRAEFGFCLLAGASQEDHPPFRKSRIRTQAEEKSISAMLLGIHPG